MPKSYDSDYDLRHWEDAAISFRKASNYLAGDQLPDQSDYCLEKCAECYIEMAELEMAASLYVLLAQGCVQVYNPFPPYSHTSFYHSHLQ